MFLRELLCIASLVFSTGSAEASPPQTAALTLYQGQGVDADPGHILPDLLSGDLRYEDTYFTGLGYYHPLDTPGILQKVFDVLHIPGTGTGFELVAVKHYGMQDNAEIEAAYSLRFPAGYKRTHACLVKGAVPSRGKRG